ncbi:MAG: methyltransferase domain-containing protein [Kofleriaceae bacterium]|nr:methyltransferase domain-containing protein [Kofleriaceae bacterium]
MDLRSRLEALPAADRDAWVDDFLGLPPLPPDEPLPPGAVPNLPAGVAEILVALDAVPVTAADHFVDIGAGLGRVALLAHLLTGARAHGIELQASLVEHARSSAANLGLTGVTFEHANAEDVELDGNVVFLYAPCNGAMLRRVLARIEQLAQRRAIVVCAVDFELHDVPWLRARPALHHSITLYDASP